MRNPLEVDDTFMLHKPYRGRQDNKNLDDLQDNAGNPRNALHAPQQHANDEQNDNNVDENHHGKTPSAWWNANWEDGGLNFPSFWGLGE
jgi:hypothetical protein